jgi:hypothetical protein
MRGVLGGGGGRVGVVVGGDDRGGGEQAGGGEREDARAAAEVEDAADVAAFGGELDQHVDAQAGRLVLAGAERAAGVEDQLARGVAVAAGQPARAQQQGAPSPNTIGA